MYAFLKKSTQECGTDPSLSLPCYSPLLIGFFSQTPEPEIVRLDQKVFEQWDAESGEAKFTFTSPHTLLCFLSDTHRAAL